MSRLHMKLTSDSHKTLKNIGANESMQFEVFWGSVQDPHHIMAVSVEWPRKSDRPVVKMQFEVDGRRV